MLASDPSQRLLHADLRLAAGLAAIAGGGNAVALRSGGLFAANMTGNVSWAADRLAAGAWIAAGFFAAVVASFIAGAFASALATRRGERRGRRWIHAACLVAEALAMAALAVGMRSAPATQAAPAACCALAAAMGWQNAVATRLTDARVRATHLSGICTDLGIELCAWLERRDADARDDAGELRRRRLAVGTVTLLAFCAGGIAGTLAFAAVGWLALLGLAGALGAFALRGWPRPAAVAPDTRHPA
jgi:uncharacterized membrane protein YoaK (UPF0700 family)